MCHQQEAITLLHGKRLHQEQQQQQQQQQTSSQARVQVIMKSASSPLPKRVRFDESVSQTTVKPSCPRVSFPLQKVMSKVHMRAQQRRRKRRSRSPPRFSLTKTHQDEEESSHDDALITTTGTDAAAASLGDAEDAPALARQLQRLERTIKHAALNELEYMNKAKQLRDKRARMTATYHAVAQRLQRQTGRDPTATKEALPPVMSSAAVRRVSMDDDHLKHTIV